MKETGEWEDLTQWKDLGRLEGELKQERETVQTD